MVATSRLSLLANEYDIQIPAWAFVVAIVLVVIGAVAIFFLIRSRR